MMFGNKGEKPDLTLDDGDLFDNQRPTSPEATKMVTHASTYLRMKGVDLNPVFVESFEDAELFAALPEELRTSHEIFAQYLLHTSKFADAIGPARRKQWGKDFTGLLGENVSLAESIHGDGRIRGAEEGARIQVEYLASIGIDPKYVLFFRATQPSETPKPEFYWTTDFHETVQGLTVEITPEQRATAVILVASLEAIAKNGGLIQDINDDSGIAVRQIGLDPFDQHECLARMMPSK